MGFELQTKTARQQTTSHPSLNALRQHQFAGRRSRFGFSVHGFENADPVAPAALGAVEGCVGCRRQRRARTRVRGKRGDTYRGTQTSEAWNLDLFDPRSQAFGYKQCAFGISLWQNQGKLVASKAASRIDASDFMTKTVSQLAQGCVAGVVAGRIV